MHGRYQHVTSTGDGEHCQKAAEQMLVRVLPRSKSSDSVYLAVYGFNRRNQSRKHDSARYISGKEIEQTLCAKIY
jgi:hypothetical protein